MKGKKFSEEHISNLCEASKKRNLKRENNPFYGKKHSEETRKHWSDIRKGNYGRPCSEETKLKIGLANKDKVTDEKHYAWKGDKVGYRALHEYVRRRLLMPEFCIVCDKKPPTDLANITGIYNRELKNWGYMCRVCHLIYDNIYERNLKRKKKV